MKSTIPGESASASLKSSGRQEDNRRAGRSIVASNDRGASGRRGGLRRSATTPLMASSISRSSVSTILWSIDLFPQSESSSATRRRAIGVLALASLSGFAPWFHKSVYRQSCRTGLLSSLAVRGSSHFCGNSTGLGCAIRSPFSTRARRAKYP